MTDAPIRIQRRRTKGWRMPENTVYVGRPTVFGNPMPNDIGGHAHAADWFRRWLADNMSMTVMAQSSRADWGSYSGVLLVTVQQHLLRRLPELRGKNLACWCALDQPCHADILLELANAPLSPTEGEPKP